MIRFRKCFASAGREMNATRNSGGSGKTVSEIAAALSLSVKTVSTYRIRLLGKLQMRSNAELMRYAIENRLVDP